MNYAETVRRALRTRLPNGNDSLLDMYALLVLVKGIDVTLENVRDAWSLWCSRNDPDHQSIVPFGELSSEVQELERKYADAIRATARLWNAAE